MSNYTLMIQTKNKKKYYTNSENVPMLIEFAKTFGAELTLIESPDVNKLELGELALALCDDSYKSPKIGRSIRVIQKLYPVE